MERRDIVTYSSGGGFGAGTLYVVKANNGAIYLFGSGGAGQSTPNLPFYT